MVRMDRFLVTAPLPISSVRVSYVCERVCEGLYVDGECVCARVFLCVSVLEKADLRDLCSTFTLLLIHPFAPTVFTRLDRMGGETKRVQEGWGGNWIHQNCFYYIVNNNVCNVYICFILSVNLQAMYLARSP